MSEKFIREFWDSLKKMQGSISSEQFMEVVIGIVFLRSVSEKYKIALNKLKTGYSENWEYFIDDFDVLASDYNCSIIVPTNSTWDYIAEFATSSELGKKLDEAFLLLEEKNNILKGLFDKIYNRNEQDQVNLGKIVSLFSNIPEEDIISTLKKIFKYFLEQFYLDTKNKTAKLYTPQSILNVMTELIEPNNGKLYDPVCGTGGFLVSAKNRILNGFDDEFSLATYGQELEHKAWRIANVNLLINEFNAFDIHLGEKSADTLKNDQHSGIVFDYILANPEFNQSDWGLELLGDDPRWQWGRPPSNNANYAWISHILYKLNPNKGRAAILLSNGSLSASGSESKDFRKNLTTYNKVEAIISLPDKMFFKGNIQASIWLFNNDKKTKDILFIDATKLQGDMVSKKLKILTQNDVELLKDILCRFRECRDINELGFSKSATLSEIEESDYSFVPGRYVGFVKESIDREKLKEDLGNSAKELRELYVEFNDLFPEVELAIDKALKYDEQKQGE